MSNSLPKIHVIAHQCAHWCGNPHLYETVFLIHRLGELPESEMKEARLFKAPPQNLTYPDVTPKLMEQVCALLSELGAQ